jgi:hypothetical protein
MRKTTEPIRTAGRIKSRLIFGTCRTQACMLSIQSHLMLKKLLGTPRRRWVDKVKLDITDTGRDGTNCTAVVQDRKKWRALANKVTKLRKFLMPRASQQELGSTESCTWFSRTAPCSSETMTKDVGINPHQSNETKSAWNWPQHEHTQDGTDYPDLASSSLPVTFQASASIKGGSYD